MEQVSFTKEEAGEHDFHVAPTTTKHASSGHLFIVWQVTAQLRDPQYSKRFKNGGKTRVEPFVRKISMSRDFSGPKGERIRRIEGVSCRF